MVRFIVRRLLQLVPILLGLSILVFIWIRALPGSPAEALLGERATPARVRSINHQYGLDKPIYVQYWNYLKQTATGNLGNSITTGRTVVWEFKQRFPATIELALGAMIFAIGLGIPLGFVAAKRYGTWIDGASLFGSLIGISIPIFLLGLYLKWLFGIKLGWLPTLGRETVPNDFKRPTNFYILDGFIERNPAQIWDALKHLIL